MFFNKKAPKYHMVSDALVVLLFSFLLNLPFRSPGFLRQLWKRNLKQPLHLSIRFLRCRGQITEPVRMTRISKYRPTSSGPVF